MPKMINVSPKFLPSQVPFYADDSSPYPCFIGGYRSGKTHIGCQKMIKSMFMNFSHAGRPVNFLVVAPTHSLLKTVIIPKIKELIPTYGIKPDINLSDMVVTTPIGLIYLRSGFQPETIIGFEVGGVWIDEPGVQKREALDRSAARLSDIGSRTMQTILTGTPEPGKQENWWEDFCDTAGVQIYRSSTREAVEYGTIDKTYIDRLKTIYSDKLLQAYIDGEFVNINEHLMFYEFRNEPPHIHSYTFNPELPVLLAWDFNVNPLCVNIAQMETGKIRVFDEVHLANSDTRQAADQIVSRYDKAKVFYVFGDASARARDTRNSKVTDMDIIVAKLQKAQKQVYNRINTSNPSIRNTANLVNGILAPSNGDPLLSVDPRCRHIIKDFLNVTGDKANDERLGFGHHADGIRYLCDKIFGKQAIRKAA